MKQVRLFIRYVFVLTALCTASALAQTPPSELEGTYSAMDHAIELRWHAPAALPLPDHYNVYRRIDGEPSFLLLATAPDRRYDDGSPTIGIAYQYQVTAVYSGDAESAPTNSVSVLAGSDSAGSGSLPPRSLAGTFDDRGAVELGWLPPDSMQHPLAYRVYRNGDGDSAFAMIGTAPELEFDDSLVLAGVEYGYYVTALYAGNVESAPSNLIGVFTHTAADSSNDGGGGHHGALSFTSLPARIAPIHEMYAYAPVMATQPSGATVCFELHHAPSGMTMEPSTGALSWTPGSLGVFEVEIRARICSPSSDGEAEQKFNIMVLAGNPGSITGHVTDGAAHPIARVRMKIFDATNGAFVLKTRTDSAGVYGFPTVNAGTYFIRADADSDRFEDEWYNGVTRLADATGVLVAEGSTVTADFVLHVSAGGAGEHVTFSGTVRDSAGAPIAGAHVTAFHSSHHASGSDDVFNDDHHHGAGSDDDHAATTDSAGAYRMTVDAGSYIVRAKSLGFLEQFWDGKDFLLEANILTLSVDTTNIDFALRSGRHGTTGTGVISGTIRAAADSTPLRSHVMGLQRNFMGQFTGFVASVRSDSNGSYALEGLPTGFYVVLAKHEDEFIPAFYTPAGGTPYLDSAATLFVDASSIAGADIYLTGDSADGLNEIEGEVEFENEHPGKAAARVPTAAAALPGTIVVVTTAEGASAGSTISDNAGAYRIAGLAAGTYRLTFQKPGSATVRASATLAYANNVPATFSVNALLPAQPPAQAGLMSVHANWNLVSVPVGAADLQKSVLFPAATSQAFGFAGRYQASTALEYGSGYWMKFPGTQVLSLAGTERLTQTIPLSKGWNLIGSLSYPVAVSALQTSPAGVVSTDFFAYGGGYATASIIEPGRGYWVKAADAGTLTMQVASGAAASGTTMRPAASDVPSLTISDNEGNAQTLSFSTGAQGVSRELPPAPPAGAFDVRFASGNMAEVLPADLRTLREYPLSLQLRDRTITITWSAASAGQRFRLVNERGATIASSDKGPSTVTLGAAARLAVIAEPSALPKEFSLQQNYPNPFNPSTSIRFELPAASRATIRVYNLIGQEVSVLLDNKELGAGAHSVVFDASRLSTGVYLYRLDAARSDDPSARFSEVRKMVLVK